MLTYWKPVDTPTTKMSPLHITKTSYKLLLELSNPAHLKVNTADKNNYVVTQRVNREENIYSHNFTKKESKETNFRSKKENGKETETTSNGNIRTYWGKSRISETNRNAKSDIL